MLLVAGHLTMAFEGRPAQEALIYAARPTRSPPKAGSATRRARLMVDGQPYQFRRAEGGGLEIKDLPAGASLPAILPAGDYEMTKTTDPAGENAFYLAVSLIIMGVGFLKPNISTIVGQLYPQGDPRRDSGFTLYYYGINLGAFWASVLCAYLARTRAAGGPASAWRASAWWPASSSSSSASRCWKGTASRPIPNCSGRRWSDRSTANG